MKNTNLIVVAHPDDETLFFGNLLLNRKHQKFHVICVTDGNADGQKTRRLKQFRAAALSLGVKQVTIFDMPDIYSKRLDIREIQKKLEAFASVKNVFTHGPIGEYGHPHHQDVSFAVHEFFHSRCPVYSVAYNCAPDFAITINEKLFLKKAHLLSKIYFSETERFINILPATFAEGFCRLDFKEVRSIYKFFVAKNGSSPKHLKKYKWLKPYFRSLRERTRTRLF